uniref:(California timema) hypothetical protein n=1 Tax=Timema californicum TaxID=61474 RepID=A0A7R9PE67_TIMCA|nr:unnamed protein product [Timema californicum]
MVLSCERDVLDLFWRFIVIPGECSGDLVVKLVVVDSLTFPFLHNSSNSLSKTRLLSLAVEKLHVIASQHNVSVVLTNQLSTRVCPGMESNLIPSQGESYGQSMNQRLIVGCYHSNHHAAVLFKSVNTPYTSAMFQVSL